MGNKTLLFVIVSVQQVTGRPGEHLSSVPNASPSSCLEFLNFLRSCGYFKVLSSGSWLLPTGCSIFERPHHITIARKTKATDGSPSSIPTHHLLATHERIRMNIACTSIGRATSAAGWHMLASFSASSKEEGMFPLSSSHMHSSSHDSNAEHTAPTSLCPLTHKPHCSHLSCPVLHRQQQQQHLLNHVCGNKGTRKEKSQPVVCLLLLPHGVPPGPSGPGGCDGRRPWQRVHEGVFGTSVSRTERNREGEIARARSSKAWSHGVRRFAA